ncbi:MAG: glycosyltransferase family 2 protein [Sedimentisphaerales bacterium]|nr:glycosyltransferase family 2 protein [Sedimentisphaerales bacterium]
MDTRQQQYQISVIIPAYNAGSHIARAIQSVLDQTHAPDEIIVVDDGSTDNTSEIVQGFPTAITCIRQENQGSSAARNTGIKAAGNDWIAFLDSDDEWLPDKLQLQVQNLRHNPELVWTWSNFYRCLCDEHRRGPNIKPIRADKLLRGRDYLDEFFQSYIHRTFGWTGTMLIRKDVLEEAGLFIPGQHMGDDIDLWFRIACRYPRIGYLSRPLAVYHMNVNQSITHRLRQTEIHPDFIKRHLTLTAEHNRREDFEPLAGEMVSRWIRSLLFENRPDDIRELMNEFNTLLTTPFKMIIRLLLICPRATALVCHTISRIVRTLHLRQRIIRKPPDKIYG